MFCKWLSRLFNLKSELTLAHSWFSIVKRTKERVLQWIIEICAISSDSWHLHKSDFSLQNSEKDVFCDGLSHLCNLKSELTLAQIGFSIVKHSKRRVLRWIIAFVQFKVRVETCTKLIFHRKTHKKRCFAKDYRICVIYSQSWHLHKSDFPL